jgi:hydroxyacylglutathione hydrolase
MIVKTLAVGPLEVNCYIIGDEKSGKAMVIDAGGDAEEILEIVSKNNLTVEYIICTHGHFDHVGAVGAVKTATGAKILLHKDELELYTSAPLLARSFGLDYSSQPAPDQFVAEGDILNVGSLNFKVMHMPGHSPGGIALYGEGIALTGDTLFAGSIGRTDLPGSNGAQIGRSLGRLVALPGDTTVLCGHGPASTIGKEKRDNPFSHLFS